MEFKLSFPINKLKHPIQADAKLFFAGSCFSENIARLFNHYKFDVCSNTHGILYNPVSIASAISDCLDGKRYTESDLFFANDTWNSFQHHSRFSHPDAQVCVNQINDSILKGKDSLEKADFVFITLGSAFVYQQKQSNIFVANCHKIPQKEFNKTLLSKEHIVECYQQLFSKIHKVNPKTHLVLTISPVRYIRDGVSENNLSKSVLIQAAHDIVATTNNCYYFPAYEIVNDELRDYRFFEADFVHPNSLAINYVWERLRESCFSADTLSFVSELDSILKASEHRPFNPNATSHEKFKQSFFQRCLNFERAYPFVDLQKEKSVFGV